MMPHISSMPSALRQRARSSPTVMVLTDSSTWLATGGDHTAEPGAVQDVSNRC
jgi:hypothetical protein